MNLLFRLLRKPTLIAMVQVVVLQLEARARARAPLRVAMVRRHYTETLHLN